jgi:rhombotail lipoprotein
MRTLALVVTLVMAMVLSGCEALCAPSCGAPREHHSSSNLVDFLYPAGALPPPENSIPELHVPLRVGLAFLPAHDPNAAGPDAALKEQLLEQVRQHFSDRKFVSDIVIIPDYYLGTQRGYPGLQALQRLYSLDVVALVSYDQVMHTQENNWSLGYITIVGAYVLKGDRYDVSTLVDLAVVDPATRSLILRAGGVDTRHGNSTLVDLPQESRESSAAAFSTAADQMIEHLDHALTDFEAQVRAGHANVQVVHKDGSRGGAGAFSWGWLLALVPLLAWRARRRAAAAQAEADAAAEAEATAPAARSAARRPVVRSGMRRPRTARSARAIRMRVPRLSVRN